MVRRRVLTPLLKISSITTPSNLVRFSTSAEPIKTKTLTRKAIPILLLSLTGGCGLSAVDDLLIFHECSSKAIEKASQNQAIVDALGEPILRGPWYNASLAVAHQRHSVSCTFPVSGPQGTGIFQLKAVHGGDTWFPYLRHRDWDILVMEALLNIPANEEQQQTFRISLSDNILPTASAECNACTRTQELVVPERK